MGQNRCLAGSKLVKKHIPNLGVRGSTNSPGANFECSREATNPEGASLMDETSNPLGRAKHSRPLAAFLCTLL